MVAIVEVLKWPTLIQSTNRLPCLRLIIFHPSQISDFKNGRNTPLICIQPGKPSLFRAPRRRRSVAHACYLSIWRNHRRSSEACKFGCNNTRIYSWRHQSLHTPTLWWDPTASRAQTIYNPSSRCPWSVAVQDNREQHLRDRKSVV